MQGMQGIAEAAPEGCDWLAPRVLLVSDRPERLQSCEGLLQGMGVVCVSASSAGALERTARHAFAFILLEVAASDMTGLATARRIREDLYLRRTPILFVTDLAAHDPQLLPGYALGAVDYLALPVVPDILRGKATWLLELHRQCATLEQLDRDLTEARATLAREERYRGIFEHPTEHMVVLEAVRDAAGTITDWRYRDANTTALAFLRRPRVAVVGQLLSHVQPGNSAASSEFCRRALIERKPQRYETRIGERIFQVCLFAIGEHTIVSSSFDITVRTRAEQETQRQSDSNRAEKEWLAALLGSMTEEVYFTDCQGRYTYANPAAVRELGHEAVAGVAIEEIVGNLEVLRLDGTPCPMGEAPPLRALRGEVIRSEEQIVRIPRTGELRHRQVSSAPVRDAAGEIIGAVSVVRDVTEQKQIEDLVRSHNQWLELAHRASRIGVFEWNIQTGMHYWTEEIEALYGLLPGAFGDGVAVWEACLHPADRERVLAINARSAALGEPFDEEFRVMWPGGTVRWLHARCSILHDASGRPHRMVGVNVDITERKHAEAERLEAERRKDEFLATLAHELRNPLAPIRNAVHIMKLQDDGSDPRLGDIRDVIDRQVKHMTRLVDDLLDISRISRGRIELQRETFDVTLALSSALEACKPVLEQHRHTLHYTPPRTALLVVGDFVRLSQVFTNLLSNAAKYTPPGGHIEVALRREANRIIVDVRDNGIGIPHEMLVSIFELFVQVDSSFERSHGGLGIGLTLAKQLVELHGGHIEARSAGRDHGSEFTVCLPLAEIEEKEPASDPVAIDAPIGKQRILIADDNADAADSLAALLEALGHETHVVYAGRRAIEVAAAVQPAIGIIDIGMPQCSGYDVAMAIRAQPGGKRMRLIALTGWGQAEDQRRAHAAGFDQHLTKPAELSELLASMAGPREE